MRHGSSSPLPFWAGARKRHRAFEARRAGVEIQDAVEIGRERALARIDIEMNAGAVAVGPLPDETRNG